MNKITAFVLKHFGKTDDWRRMIVRFLLSVFIVICTIYTFEGLTGHDGGASYEPVVWVGLTVVLAFMFFLTFKLKDCQNLYFVILLFAGGFVLPSNFLSVGGVSLGASMLLLLMGLLLVFLLLDGWRFYVALAVVLAADVYVHIFSLVHPEQVVVTVAYNRIVIIGLIYLVSIGVIIGMIIRLQIYRLEKEMQISQEKQKEIERISESKSLFLANMSHEIRTPINAVLGMNEMILRECDDENILRYASNAYNSGNALLSIINDVLDISKIEAGKLEIVNAEYDLPSLISDCYHMTLNRAQKKGLEFIVECDEDIPSHFNGDMFHIRQIVVNFITNAIKYTDNGFAKLSVSGEKSGDYYSLRFAVSDTGIGLKPEDIDKLFTNFQRFDLKRNQSVEGTGLGLSICKQLAELMGGNVRVESVYGKGSTFICEIPQQIVSDKPIGKLNLDITAESITVGEQEHFAAPTAHILVVDDVEMNLFVFTSLLKEHEMKIDTAQSGKRCLELLANNTYDIIFLDHMMPEMDGMETFARIREQNLAENTPVIMLTANAISGEREKYLAAGFSSYLSKPIKSEKLDKMLLDYLPSEKIERREKAEKSGEKLAAVSESTELIDVSLGISYSANSEDVYNEILKSYVDNSGILSEKLRRYCEEKDFSAYVIEVHALKGMSLNIGARKLSEAAKELELAGKNGDYALIESKNAALLEQYETVVSEAKKYLEQHTREKDNSEDTASAEITEISFEEFTEYIEKIKSACNEYNSTKISEICREASAYSCRGTALKPLLDEVKALADDFECEKALEKTQELWDKIQSSID